MPRRLAKPRPKQAARLVALRKAAGLSQAELGELVDVSPKTIAFWETSATKPRSDVLPRLASALGVRIEELLGEEPVTTRRSGPMGKLQVAFEQARSLPRRQQALITEFVETLVEKNRRAG
jgi:transcriptional regulator with XRE-family HTH domain